MTYANTTKFPPPLRLRSACDQHRCNPPRRPSQNYRSLSHHLAPFSHFAIAVYRLRIAIALRLRIESIAALNSVKSLAQCEGHIVRRSCLRSLTK